MEFQQYYFEPDWRDQILLRFQNQLILWFNLKHQKKQNFPVLYLYALYEENCEGSLKFLKFTSLFVWHIAHF